MNVGGNLEHNKIEKDPYIFDSARYREVVGAAAFQAQTDFDQQNSVSIKEKKKERASPRYKMMADPLK